MQAALRAAAEAERVMEVRADRLRKNHQTSWLRSLFCSWALMAAENLENQVTAVVTLQHVQQGIKVRNEVLADQQVMQICMPEAACLRLLCKLGPHIHLHGAIVTQCRCG